MIVNKIPSLTFIKRRRRTYALLSNVFCCCCDLSAQSHSNPEIKFILKNVYIFFPLFVTHVQTDFVLFQKREFRERLFLAQKYYWFFQKIEFNLRMVFIFSIDSLHRIPWSSTRGATTSFPKWYSHPRPYWDCIRSIWNKFAANIHQHHDAVWSARTRIGFRQRARQSKCIVFICVFVHFTQKLILNTMKILWIN